MRKLGVGFFGFSVPRFPLGFGVGGVGAFGGDSVEYFVEGNA